MCNNTAPDLQTTSMIKKEATSDTIKPPARRSRTRTRKPKFLSLKLELSPGESQSSGDASSLRHHQLNLFPLHPENLMHDENVDYLLDSGGGATLTGLLETTISASSEYESQQSPSLSYTHRGQKSEEAMLVRTAMKRSKEREVSEEKWVCYEEVVEKKVTAEDEVTSCSAAPIKARSLSLKLDYQEILDAWSDKGSLYIEATQSGDQCPQIVPNLSDDDFFGSANKNVVTDGWGNVGNLWTVPENSGSITSSVKTEDDGTKEGWSSRAGQREASVLRYKEKRQNRLFSKRIRYEVRKLNAEKRPRMKGRFVKRN